MKKNNKIKALGIAPYEGMKSMMLKLADERDDIDLTVYVGDLNKGVEIAQNNFVSNYDVIISRGGTAEMISEITSIPLVEISLSVYDILRAIKLAENYSDRYAIVGFPSITSSAQLLCDLLQYKIDIFTIHNIDEVQVTLNDLKRKGYRMVLCDMITTTTAKALGLNAILITSGNEGILSAFDQAVKLCRSYVSLKNDNHFLEDMIKGHPSQTVVFDAQHNIFFSTLGPDNNDLLLDVLMKEVDETLSSETHKCFKNIEGKLYAITGKKIINQDKHYAAFYFSCDYAPIAHSKYGIKFTNRSDAENHFFNSFHSVANSNSDIDPLVAQFNQCTFPIMVTGETGTGKEQIVEVLYSRSNLSHHPLISINCSLINDKGWGFLTNHYNSPLNDNNNTLFFKDLNALSEQRKKQLLTIIVDMNLCKRNRMVFSYVANRDESIPPAAMDYVNQLSCITIHLPPLSARSDEIPTLSSLYLSTLNIDLAKQIIGFEPEALALLQAYSWPYNYTQFKRILSELAVITTTPYISVNSVTSVLEKEITATTTSAYLDKPFNIDQHCININRTLEEINQEIIQTVLKENNGNQSVAAKKLGLSRTTLWRYLK